MSSGPTFRARVRVTLVEEAVTVAPVTDTGIPLCVTVKAVLGAVVVARVPLKVSSIWFPTRRTAADESLGTSEAVLVTEALVKDTMSTPATELWRARLVVDELSAAGAE